MKRIILPVLGIAFGAGLAPAQDIVFQAGDKQTADNLPAPNVVEVAGVNYADAECLGQPGVKHILYSEYLNGEYTGIKYAVEAQEAGEYELAISYFTMDQRYIAVKVNDCKEEIVRCSTTDAWGLGDYDEENGYNTPAVSIVKVWLNAGENIIKVSAAPIYYPIAGQEGNTNFNYLPNIYKFAFTKVADSDKNAADFADSAVAPIFIEAEGGFEVSNPDVRNPFHTNETSGNYTGAALDMGAYGLYSLDIPEEGAYLMRLWYCTMQNRPFVITAEDYPAITATAAGTSGNWDSAHSYIYVPVYLKEGKQTLKLSGDGSNYGPVADCFELVPFSADWYEAPQKDTSVKYPQYALSSAAKYTSDIFDDLSAIRDFSEWTSVNADKKEGTVTLEFPWNTVITGFGIATENNTADWKLEYSNDGENWLALEIPANFYKFTTKAIERGSEGNLYNEVIPTKYVRLTIAGDQDASLAELSVYGYPYVANESHNPVGLVNAANIISNDGGWPDASGPEGIGKIADGFNTTWWTRNEGNDPVEIEVKLDTEYLLDSYLVAIPYRASQQARNLRGWSLSGGEEMISEVENMNWVAQGAAVIIPVEPASAYDSYKLTIPNAQAYQPHMAAFQLYGTEATGVEKVEVKAVAKVAGLKGEVAFEGEAGASFGIYTANGVNVAAGIVAAGTNNIALSAGLYIVRIGDKAVKVVVK